MPNTTNFNWPTPADTDLVKDGAAAIRNLGNGIDTSLIDLKGGTTGQILSKASNADMDFTFITPNVGDITEVQAGTGISVASGTGPIPVVTNSMATEITAKGDLIVGTGNGTFDNLPVGTNGYTLVADSVETTGLKWVAPSSAALTLINTTSFSAVGSQSFNNVFSSTYTNYRIYLSTYATGDSLMTWRFRASGSDDSTANYYFSVWGAAASTGTLSSDNNGSGATNIQIGSNNNTNQRQYVVLDIHNPHQTTATKGITYNYVRSRTGIFGGTGYGLLDVTGTAFDGFTLTGGTITGTASIYGWSV